MFNTDHGCGLLLVIYYNFCRFVFYFFNFFFTFFLWKKKKNINNRLIDCKKYQVKLHINTLKNIKRYQILDKYHYFCLYWLVLAVVVYLFIIIHVVIMYFNISSLYIHLFIRYDGSHYSDYRYVCIHIYGATTYIWVTS